MSDSTWPAREPGRHERDEPGEPGSLTVDRTVITLRPLASPLPLGLFAFGIGNLLLAVAQLGGFTATDMRTAMIMLGTFVALPQFVASIFGFLTREPIVATLLGLLAVSWPTDVVVQLVTGAMTSPPRGLLYLGIAGALALLAVPVVTAKPLVAGIVVLAALRFVANGLYDLTGVVGWERASGAVAIAVTASCAYTALALVFEDVRHHTVLPVGRLGESADALSAGLPAQEASLPHEAGVRAQL